MPELTRLLEATEERHVGPPTTYTQAHFLLALLTIGDLPKVGRQLLARKVGLGGGAVRTLLKKFREEGLIKVTRSGVTLTEKGLKTYGEVKNRLPKIIGLDSSDLTVGSKQVAIIARGLDKRVMRGIEQRDAAIVAGAAGATTYVMSDSKFQIPTGSRDCEKGFPSSVWGILRRELVPKDGDVVIVCGSSSELVSKLGVVSAALTLLK